MGFFFFFFPSIIVLKKMTIIFMSRLLDGIVHKALFAMQIFVALYSHKNHETAILSGVLVEE